MFALFSNENWKIALGLIFAGFVFFCLSFAYLPFFLLFPSKFAASFTLGSILLLSGIALFKGLKEFGSILLKKSRIPFSIAYVASLGGTLYATFYGSYVIVLICVITQVIALLWLISSTFPGGTSFMKTMTKTGYYAVVKIFKGIFGKKEKSLLPI